MSTNEISIKFYLLFDGLAIMTFIYFFTCQQSSLDLRGIFYSNRLQGLKGWTIKCATVTSAVTSHPALAHLAWPTAVTEWSPRDIN